MVDLSTSDVTLFNIEVVAGILSKLMIISFHYLLKSVPTRGRGLRYKLPEPGGPEGGPVPDDIACVFVFVVSIFIFHCTN